jgi:hypothetical protein
MLQSRKVTVMYFQFEEQTTSQPASWPSDPRHGIISPEPQWKVET